MQSRSSIGFVAILLAFILLNHSSCKKDDKEEVVEPTISVTGFAPEQGPVGTSVTISGKNFVPKADETQITIGGITAPIQSVSENQVVITIPETAQSGKFELKNNGQNVTTSLEFFVIHPPTITSFTPTKGAAGTEVTITGNNFSTNTTANSVQFNGIPTTVASASKTQLKVVVPPTATTGKIKVTVSTLAATSAETFTVIFPPTITAFRPASGLIGASVKIDGTNFKTTPADNNVRFGTAVADITSATATELIVNVPVGATNGPITVTTTDGTITSVESFTVLVPPTITSFNPTIGAIGSTVEIKGTNFSNQANGNVVKFNGTTATVSEANVTTIKATVPAGATTGKITVTTAGGTAGSAGNFTIGCPDLTILNAVITEITPTKLSFGYDLKNLGNVPADLSNFKFYAYISDDQTYSESDVFAATAYLADTPPVPANGNISTSTSLLSNLFATQATLKYLVIVIRSVSGSEITHIECNENNNAIARPLYADIPRTGLIAFYPFNGNGDETVNNTALRRMMMNESWSPTLAADRFGNSNRALNFIVGQNGLVQTSILPLQPWTISWWMKYADLSEIGLDAGILSTMANTQGININLIKRTTNYSFNVWGDDGVVAGGGYGLTDNSVTHGYITTIGDGNWVHITMTYSGSVFKIYFNAIEVESVDVLATTVIGPQLLLGKAGLYSYKGQLDDLAIYNRAIPQHEVIYLKNQTFTKY